MIYLNKYINSDEALAELRLKMNKYWIDQKKESIKKEIEMLKEMNLPYWRKKELIEEKQNHIEIIEGYI